jgi:hypothetical protein
MQLEIIPNGASETVTEYEPYTGGIPSPNPDYPQELVSAGDGGSLGVKVLGKNIARLASGKNYSASVEFTDNKFNAVITAATGSVFCVVGRTTVTKGVTYIISSDAENIHGFRLFKKGTTDPVFINVGGMIKNGNPFIPLEDAEADIALYFRFTDGGNNTVGTIASGYLQCEIGSIATAYEHYKEPQTMIHQTPNGLPGIHVSEGGNYTDENGWQWICDEVDFGRGVYVQRVAKGTITEKNYDNIQLNYSSDKSLLVGFGKPFGKENGLSKRACLSDRFVTYHGNNPQSLSGFPGDVEHIGFNTSAAYAEYFYMRIFRNRLATQDAAGVKAWLADNNINVLYQLITPIETPLSAEELAAYAALHTNYPSTTLYNDADSYMEVKYMAKGG